MVKSTYCSFWALWDWYLWQQASSQNKRTLHTSRQDLMVLSFCSQILYPHGPQTSLIVYVLLSCDCSILNFKYLCQITKIEVVTCLMQMTVSWYERICVCSFSHCFFSSPLLTGQVLERIATEFNQLQFHAVQSKGMPLLDKVRPVSVAWYPA